MCAKLENQRKLKGLVCKYDEPLLHTSSSWEWICVKNFYGKSSNVSGVQYRFIDIEHQQKAPDRWCGRGLIAMSGLATGVSLAIVGRDHDEVNTARLGERCDPLTVTARPSVHESVTVAVVATNALVVVLVELVAFEVELIEFDGFTDIERLSRFDVLCGDRGLASTLACFRLNVGEVDHVA